jgi:hypothetical protein
VSDFTGAGLGVASAAFTGGGEALETLEMLMTTSFSLPPTVGGDSEWFLNRLAETRGHPDGLRAMVNARLQHPGQI